MVRLIPKKGDLSKLGNWRPISLLNTDYKIFATILRNRIAPMADYLISKEQIGFKRGRNIDTNIWLVNQEYMDYQVSKDGRIMIFYDLKRHMTMSTTRPWNTFFNSEASARNSPNSSSASMTKRLPEF